MFGAATKVNFGAEVFNNAKAFGGAMISLAGAFVMM